MAGMWWLYHIGRVCCVLAKHGPGATPSASYQVLYEYCRDAIRHQNPEAHGPERRFAAETEREPLHVQ